MRQASRPPLARMVAIAQALRANRYPNAKTLADELEVNARTIRRDIEFMRDRLDAPIGFDPRRNGYHFTREDYEFGFIQVGEGELIAVLLGCQLLNRYRGTPFEADLRRAFDKLARVLPESVGVRFDAIADVLTVMPAVDVEYDPEIFATLARAVLERRALEVAYRSPDRDPRETPPVRTLKPYSLLFREEAWYLVAWDGLRGEIRTFALQRFQSARETGERFDRPPDFRTAEYLAGSFGVLRGNQSHDVALRFHPPAAQRVAERTWARGQTLQWLENGRLLLRFRVNDLRQVKRWVMSWGTECEPLEPDQLRTAVRDELVRSLDQLSQSDSKE